MNKTTLGYELKACGMNRHSARYAGIRDKRNIVLSMAIAGGLAGGGAALYYLSGNTEFFWSTYQTLPAEGFNGIPVALLAVNNPIAVIFTAIFMSVLDIAGLQLTNLTAYNEYITDVIIAAIVYLSAFSLVIRMLLDGRKQFPRHESLVKALRPHLAVEIPARRAVGTDEGDSFAVGDGGQRRFDPEPRRLIAAVTVEQVDRRAGIRRRSAVGQDHDHGNVAVHGSAAHRKRIDRSGGGKLRRQPRQQKG